jgi:glutamate racemase
VADADPRIPAAGRAAGLRELKYSSGVADSPIGIFDSGYGGLTVARAVLDQLPHEPVFYLGDTARAPYGPRPIAEVRKFALECLDQLVEQGVKMLVIACNSASSAMLRDARERYSVPVVEVIHPAARRAVAATRNGRIGVISTMATKTSRAYDDALAAVPNVTLTSQACPRFVEFVEDGVTGGEELIKVAHEYLDPVAGASVDTLILGCTHYPLVAPMLQRMLGRDVRLVAAGHAIAASAQRILEASGLEAEGGEEGDYRFLCTGDADSFRELGTRFLQMPLGEVEHV